MASRRRRLAARNGYAHDPAVRDGDEHEVKSLIILRIGPAALIDGPDARRPVISEWVEKYGIEGGIELIS